ncbi:MULTISPECIES: LVIVD repeat-containing protein [unclassified Amycolatopsis]|uniref:LVIVD repeat-containing protein n=1 Tax=unclassified Amycolatopsis TaxID=2618356 RepID=UPI0002626D73|nr:hypothetical protein [Amycolatopsis sp. ATCC 39116]
MAPGTQRRRRLFALAGAIALSLTTLGAAPASAAPGIPGVDEVSQSRNIQHLANIPKQAPFDNVDAFGTDIAFTDDHAIVGNYNGFTIYDIKKPSKPKIVSQVLCPGSQNDVSVSGDLLFLSTDSSRSDNSCASAGQPATNQNSWEGIKIFDISDLANPKYVAAVETKCGSHTHTLVPGKNGKDVYLYVSSYSPRPEFPDCQPPHDLISVVKVPVRNPAAAAVVNEPVVFGPEGGNPGIPGTFPNHYVTATSGCHDITAYPDKDLAAGACMGDGVLFDISDREHPRIIEQVQDDTNFAFWHSATFNNDGTKVVFTDELGGGGQPACSAGIGAVRGADAIYDITGRGDDRSLRFASYFKIPREQAATENCVAHNGSLIPVKGRDIMVQAWYQGGISVWDFTDSAHPKELAHWERGPLSTEQLIVGGSWSAYYYNGHIYSSDIQKGLDVFALHDPRTASAKSVRMDELNVQTQGRYRG